MSWGYEELSMWSAEDFPASRSPSQESDSDGTTFAVTSSGTRLTSPSTSKRRTSSLRTYPDSLAALRVALSERSSLTWPKQGLLTSNGEFLTPSFSESPNGVSECGSSLAEILQPSVDERYLLSAKACAGILRRAERRGRKLPAPLREALLAVVLSAPSPGTDSEGGADDNLAQAGHLVPLPLSTPAATQADSAPSPASTSSSSDMQTPPRLANSHFMQDVASTVTTGTGVRYDPDTESLVVLSQNGAGR